MDVRMGQVVEVAGFSVRWVWIKFPGIPIPIRVKNWKLNLGDRVDGTFEEGHLVDVKRRADLA